MRSAASQRARLSRSRLRASTSNAARRSFALGSGSEKSGRRWRAWRRSPRPSRTRSRTSTAPMPRRGWRRAIARRFIEASVPSSATRPSTVARQIRAARAGVHPRFSNGPAWSTARCWGRLPQCVGGIAAMDDGARVSESGSSVEAGVPLVIAERVVGGGASLLIIALFAYLKGSLSQILRVVAWLLGGREHAERKLVEAGVGELLTLSPRLTAFVDAAATEGRAVYILARQCSPLLEAVAARHPSIAGIIVDLRAGRHRMKRGWTGLLDRFPAGYDAVVSRRGR